MSESREKYEAALDLEAIRGKWASLAGNDWDIIVSYADKFIPDLIAEVEKLRAMLKTVVAQLPNEEERRLLEAQRIMQSPFEYIDLKKL